MALDLSLLAVPDAIENIFSRTLEKQDSEYPDLIFFLAQVFQTGFNDFGHPDRVEFKNDAQSLLMCYPNQSFKDNYYYDSCRHFDVFDYLISNHVNDCDYSFFRGGKEFKTSKGGQGHSLLYWDREILKYKAELIHKIKFEDLIKHHDFEIMDDLGIYKVLQINEHKETMFILFNELKRFLTDATDLNGYVLVIQN